MSVLERVSGPEDLAGLSRAELGRLAEEIREFLVTNVSATGGHMGPNLGVVELTLAVHRVFDSPKDSVVFDTGHQSYVHKLLTGRKNFETLRQEGGLAGYPDRRESEHDIVESSHASSSLSWADGISRGYAMTGQHDRHTVVLVGDGALTGGMAWEAVNNIASDRDRKVVIVVNDNGRSYAPTVGGFANHLAELQASVQQGVDAVRTDRRYEQTLETVKDLLKHSGPVGEMFYLGLHGMKHGIEDVVVPQGIFEDLGMKYVGPVDGHDLEAVEQALGNAKNYGGPVIVHAITEKGHGYGPATANVDDQFHAVGVIDPVTGRSTATSSERSWTAVFSDEIARIADEREDVVASPAPCSSPWGCRRCRPPTPTGSWTWASPSSTPSPWPPAWPTAASTPWWPSTRRSSTAASTSSSWTWRCTGPASRSSSTGPGSPARTAPATTACGTSRCSRSCPGSTWPHRATSPP